MSYEVISEPFVAREPSLGGFGQRRTFVVVKHDDGRTEMKLAVEVKKAKRAEQAEPAKEQEANS